VKLDLHPGWVCGEGPESDVVVSTRARLARNLSGRPFPGRASSENLLEVAELVRVAAERMGDDFPGLKVIDLKGLGEPERERLVDAHVASYEQVEPKDGRLIILNPEASIAIMVNEEDHLRVQAILAGLQPASAWELVDRVDDCLARTLRFDYTDSYGYLTASLSNVGTGLRVSTMLHLAGLAQTGRLTRTLRAAYELGISVRGLFGEGTSGHGDFYQVSNEVTLGLPEREIVHRVRGVAEHLIGEERRARRILSEERRAECAERAAECLTILRRKKSIGAVEALGLLSPIRLAAAIGIVSGGNPRLFNELLISMGIGRLTGSRRVSWDAVKAELTRAPTIKSKLKGLNIAYS
jgi:protein arginine kinase